MPDQRKNFAYSTVATAPSPATTGTSLVVATGDGARFPAAPFNATVWPASTQPTAANAEVVRVTAISTDTLTIVRAQESSTARSIGTGDQIASTLTALQMQWADQYSGIVANFQTDLLTNAGITSILSGTGTSSNFETGVVAGHPGTYQLNCGTVSGNYAYHATTSSSSGQNTSFLDAWEVEFVFQTPSTITDTDLIIGMVSSASAAPATGMWLEKLAADSHFWLNVANGGTHDTRQDTGTTVVASTWYSVVLGWNGTQVYFSINRVAPTFYTPTNTASTVGYGVCGLVARSTTNRAMVVDFSRTTVFALAR